MGSFCSWSWYWKVINQINNGQTLKVKQNVEKVMIEYQAKKQPDSSVIMQSECQ